MKSPLGLIASGTKQNTQHSNKRLPVLHRSKLHIQLAASSNKPHSHTKQQVLKALNPKSYLPLTGPLPKKTPSGLSASGTQQHAALKQAPAGAGQQQIHHEQHKATSSTPTKRYMRPPLPSIAEQDAVWHPATRSTRSDACWCWSTTHLTEIVRQPAAPINRR
jgi:hypothetical protein